MALRIVAAAWRGLIYGNRGRCTCEFLAGLRDFVAFTPLLRHSEWRRD